MSQPQLVLVWDRDRLVGKKSQKQDQKPKASPVLSQEPEGKVEGWFKRQNLTLNGLAAIIAILGQIVLLSYFFGSWNTTLNRAVDDLEKVREDIEKIDDKMDNDLRELDARLARLEGPYREQAAKLGFEDPQIFSATLSEPSRQQISGISKGTPYNLIITIEKITKDGVVFLLEGGFAGKKNLRDIRAEVSYQVGIPFPLKKAFSIPGLPDIWITVLDFAPKLDKAVFAVGPRSTATS